MIFRITEYNVIIPIVNLTISHYGTRDVLYKFSSSSGRFGIDKNLLPHRESNFQL